MAEMLFRILNYLDIKMHNYRRSIILKNLRYCGLNVHLGYYTAIQNENLVSIGENSQISDYTVLLGANGITIGKNCRISTCCMLSSITHKINSKNRIVEDVIEIDHNKLRIEIGDNVWIGANSVILPGTSIGDNSIIGAGSIASGEIPSNEIWIGAPAVFKKHINL